MERVERFSSTRERDDHLIEVLKEVKHIYTGSLKLKPRVVDQMVVSLIVNTIKKSDLSDIGVDIDLLLSEVERYRNTFVYDDWEQNSLIDHIYESLVVSYGNLKVFSLFKISQFNKVRLFFKIVGMVIDSEFDRINLDEFKKTDQMIIQRMRNAIQNTFVNDPNILGDNPYYERHLDALYNSREATIRYLDELFDAYINYFEEDDDEDG